MEIPFTWYRPSQSLHASHSATFIKIHRLFKIMILKYVSCKVKQSLCQQPCREDVDDRRLSSTYSSYGHRCRWVVSSTLRPSYPPKRAPCISYSLRDGLDTGEEKNTSPLPGMGSQSPVRHPVTLLIQSPYRSSHLTDLAFPVAYSHTGYL
jgi:hypothetical protein